VQTDGATCWTKIAASTQLPPVPAPDCTAGYLLAKQELAAARCEIAHQKRAPCIRQEIDGMRSDDASPSVIGYEVEVAVQPPRKTVQPAGGPVSCWPAD
jgi:hypothetical protein